MMSKNSSTPLFSVIVPTYNSRNYISKCIDSILGQSFKNFEVIIVDDGSNDGTFDSCFEYLKKDETVRFIKQNNMGPGAARNTGLLHACGEYVVFIDSDDYVDPDYFLSLSTKCNNKTDIVFVGYTMENEDGDTLLSNHVSADFFENKNKSEIISKLYCDDIFGYTWCKVIKRDFLVKHNIEFLTSFPMHEDFEFICRCLMFDCQLDAVDTIGYHYIKRVSSLTALYHRDLYENLEYVNKVFFEMLEVNNVNDKIGIALERSVFSIHLLFKNFSLRKKKKIKTKDIKTIMSGKTFNKMIAPYFVFKKYVKGKKRNLYYILAKTKSIFVFKFILFVYSHKK